VNINTDTCWTWPGTLRQADGRATVGNQYAYRLVYEAATGAGTTGMSIHHTCDNPSCVNPYHLEIKTQAEHASEHLVARNQERARMRTHCKHGHLLDAENTGIVRSGRDGEHRYCRTCRKADRARYNAKVRRKAHE
jgi:hypothetical protein